MTTIAVIGPNLWDQSKGQFHVHSATCRDGLNPHKYPQEYRHELRVDSRLAVSEFIYADMASDEGLESDSPGYLSYMDDCLSDFYFHNCVSDLPESVQTPEISEEPVPTPEPLINVLRDHEEAPQEVVKLPEESVQDFIERVASTVPKPEETLVCRQCGSSFTRTIVRGRKPHRCPTCRGGQ